MEYILGVIAFILVLGMIHLWRQRESGNFKIKQNGKYVELWFNYQGEWMRDGTFTKYEDAVKCIEEYKFREADKKLRLG